LQPPGHCTNPNDSDFASTLLFGPFQAEEYSGQKAGLTVLQISK
jgi:hypothetical protein